MMRTINVLFLFIGFLCVAKGDDKVTKLPIVGPVDAVEDAVHSAADVVEEDEELLLNRIGMRAMNDIIQNALNKFKDLMLDSIELLGLPRLEPLDVKHVDIDIKHEIGIFNGSLDYVQVRKLSSYQTKNVNVRGNIISGFTVDLNLFFKEIVINGDYNLDANVMGDLVHVFGNGPFLIILHDVDTFITMDKAKIMPKVQLKDIKLNVTLGSLTSKLINLMGGGEPEELFNKVIEYIAPRAVEVLWPEIAAIVEPRIIEMLNSKELTYAELLELFK